MPDTASVTTDSFTVESTGEALDQLKATFGIVDTPDPAETPEPATKEPAPAGTETDQAASPDADSDPEPAKIDRRTREGRKASIQHEIDELTATKYNTRRELELLQAELTRLQAARDPRQGSVAPDPRAMGSAPPPPSSSAPADDPEPRIDAADAQGQPRYKSYEEFVAARARWEARQEFRAQAESFQRQQAERAAQERDQRLTEAHTERLAKARTAIPNFDQRVANAGNIPVSAPMREFIRDSDYGPELTVYLCEHPADAQRLSTLHPVLLAREIGRLEARVSAAPSGPAATPTISKAAPPIKPVGSGAPLAATSLDEGSDDEPFEAHFKRENARERRR